MWMWHLKDRKIPMLDQRWTSSSDCVSPWRETRVINPDGNSWGWIERRLLERGTMSRTAGCRKSVQLPCSTHRRYTGMCPIALKGNTSYFAVAAGSGAFHKRQFSCTSIGSRPPGGKHAKKRVRVLCGTLLHQGQRIHDLVGTRCEIRVTNYCTQHTLVFLSHREIISRENLAFSSANATLLCLQRKSNKKSQREREREIEGEASIDIHRSIDSVEIIRWKIAKKNEIHFSAHRTQREIQAIM